MRAITAVGLIACALIASTSGQANGDFCGSDEFRRAFLDGQGIIEDYFNVSRDLVVFGDVAVPCLEIIATKGEASLGIDCLVREVDGGCRTWAIAALGEIGTFKAQEALTRIVESETDTLFVTAALRQLGHTKNGDVRPVLHRNLEHPNVTVKVAAIKGLAEIGAEEDFEVVAKLLPALPDSQVRDVVASLFLLGGKRAAEPLFQRAQTIADAGTRESVEGLIEKMQAKTWP